MPKFKILPKVESFLKDGQRYFPGDVVELPQRYKSKDWLEEVKPVKAEKLKKPAVVAAKEVPPQKEESFRPEKKK
ncbi:MAG: hypothetical protein OEX10_06290 [Candidatus Bathyarchaeota archaeon]|nr:hypothetical protein [Candidatus Bathyarchaeota archaeon]